MPKPGLARRTIRTALINEYGWSVDSHEDGSIDVWLPRGASDPDDFAGEVRAAIEKLGYEPSISLKSRNGQSYVCVYTPETIAQRGAGAHRKAGEAPPSPPTRRQAAEGLAQPHTVNPATGEEPRPESNERKATPASSLKGGSATAGRIAAIKYGGRVVVLDDGSRWEVDELDDGITESWGVGDPVVILRGEMYMLADAEKVTVKPDT